MPNTFNLTGSVGIQNTDTNENLVGPFAIAAAFATAAKYKHTKKTIAAGAAKAAFEQADFTTVSALWLRSDVDITVELNDTADTQTNNITGCREIMVIGSITKLELTGNATKIATVEYILAGN